MRRGPFTLVVLVGTLLLVVMGFPSLVSLIVDWYWFQSIQFETVFLTSLAAKLGLGFGVGLVAGGFFYVNLRVAQRGLVPEPLVVGLSANLPKLDLTRLLRRLSWPTALVLALLLGTGATGVWRMALRFLNRTPFGLVDPVFGRDIGYYVFTLPILSWVLGLLLGLIVVALFLTVPLYLLRRDIVVVHRRVTIEPSAGLHVAVLIALLFVTAAANIYFVQIPSIVFSTTGPFVGGSYTDLIVRVPILHLTWVVALVGAALVIHGSRTRHLTRSTAIAVALSFAVSLIAVIVPAAMQKFIVRPNELVKETPQLEHHIAATRRAWGMDNVVTRDLSGDASLTLDDIRSNAGTIRNVRLWDRDPLLQTFGQLQEIRTYYDFVSVDDDRYWIDGEYRQVLLSPRELNSALLPTRNFINERLYYTHGMGLTLSPVNQVSLEGLPVLFVKDLPPVSTVSLAVTRPELYFGELQTEFVFVRTQRPEFDYPLGDSSATTRYDGRGGVPVRSALRKLLFSVRFRSLDVLMTDRITNDSRLLMYRRIQQRAAKALPFLRWDRDPYVMVTDDGRLKWILDGYTASGQYPYSQPLADGTNYMRNSVKVVIDAYDGDIRAYVADSTDPILQTYQKIFPGIFLPLDSMPPDIRAHIRYPEDLYSIQTALYTTYHMDDPNVFYAREDQWQIPSAGRRDGARGDPFLRHIVMKLPGEEQEEFIFMTPFTPRQKDNLAAWMVARSDGEHYGQLVVYRFPRQSLVFGPTQIVNRMNQDTEISRQVSLWDQRGSEVIQGNLLVIPINESLIFVQAVYLRAEGGQIPELKRVIVAYQNQVVMEETLAAGLARLFGGSVDHETPRAQTLAAPSVSPSAPPSSPGVAQLIREATAHYDRALAAQRAGDWSSYGEEMLRVGELLRQLRQLAGGEQP